MFGIETYTLHRASTRRFNKSKSKSVYLPVMTYAMETITQSNRTIIKNNTKGYKGAILGVWVPQKRWSYDIKEQTGRN